MQPKPDNLLKTAGITTPLIGFYDVADPEPFKPFAQVKRCFFSGYKSWLIGESVCISENEAGCQGGGYWVGGVMPAWIDKSADPDSDPLKIFAERLNQREGFKSSDELMRLWLENQRPYLIKNGYVVIGPVKESQYEYLKTVTFYVNPDQLSLLLIGSEYNTSSKEESPVRAPFGSGCGLMASVFDDLESDIPRGVIGATDIAMRGTLPPDILAFTVNKPMFRQLCELDENSFLYKHFWKNLKKERSETLKIK